MQYRKLGKINFNISSLGFGAMRLPTQDGKIDKKKADEMLFYAIDYGVNFIDTSYVYHNGESETWLGKTLKNLYREKIKLATKMPAWLINDRSDFDKYFYEQLSRLQTDHIDFYLLHTLNDIFWNKLKNLGVLEWAEDKIKKGMIGHLGFSFHGEYSEFENILNSYDWEFCLIQHNYMDIANQAGDKGLKLANSRGVAAIIMEPLRGGSLVNPPENILKIWGLSNKKRDSIEWALHWLWSKKEISCVLSGMSAIEHVKQNISYAEDSSVGLLTTDEQELVDQVRKAYNESIIIPCTKCNYCMPCAGGVNIPRLFDVYNNGYIYNKPDSSRGEYEWIGQSYRMGISKTDERVVNCNGCKSCERKCPQKIRIFDWLCIVHKVLGERKEYILRLE